MEVTKSYTNSLSTIQMCYCLKTRLSAYLIIVNGLNRYEKHYILGMNDSIKIILFNIGTKKVVLFADTLETNLETNF
jgi:hypothetical protein